MDVSAGIMATGSVIIIKAYSFSGHQTGTHACNSISFLMLVIKAFPMHIILLHLYREDTFLFNSFFSSSISFHLFVSLFFFS